VNTLPSFRPVVKFVFPAYLVLFFLVSCSKDDTPDTVDCTGLTPTYNSDIKAILDASCAKSGCHDATTMANNINLSNFASASAISQEDRFLGAIQHKSGFTAMPQDGPKLADDKIQLLSCWVQNGSPN
jgi:hypothetical protein